MRHTEVVPTVFINYRAKKQAGYAALLDRELSGRFGNDAVFRAPRSIRPGEDFAAAIIGNLHMCAVLLVLIGPGWLSFDMSCPASPGGPVDWVRLEIAEALARGITTIPVLIEDTPMPAEAQLPADIAPLTRCQAVRLHESNVANGIAEIARQVSRFVPEPGRWHRPPSQAANPRIRLFRITSAPGTAARIGIVIGDIRQVRFADIWVNSENTDMEMPRFSEFSVSAIIRYYGAHRDRTGRVLDDIVARELTESLGPHQSVAPGAAIVTRPGRLSTSHNVRHLIHVAAVQGEPGAGFRQVRNLEDCVTNALVAAQELAATDPSARTILMPLFGTGVAGAAITATVRTLLDATVDHVVARPDSFLSEIYFLAYTKKELAAIEEAIRTTPLLAPVDIG